MNKFKPPLGKQLESGIHINEGLAAWWIMNEGEGSLLNDISGNTNHGTLQSTTSWTGGLVGPTLSFNGTSDNVEALASTSLDTSGSVLTISAWVNHNVSGTEVFVEGETAFPWCGIAADGTIDVGIDPDGLGTDTFSSTGSVSANTWASIVVSLDTTNIQIYINGVLDSDQVHSGLPFGPPTVWNIGGRGDTAQFTGLIDDVRVWMRTLTSSEVFQVYTYRFKGIDAS